MRSKLVSEFIGTTFLVMIVVGSGIMGQQLFPEQDGLALLANSLATGAGLFVLIQCLGPVSGAHLNPVVSLVETLWGRLDKKAFCYYITLQFAGGYFGVLLSHIMFNQPVFQISSFERSGLNFFISEIVATFGLISVVALAGRKHVEFAPLSVAAYITSAYWFTSSTSFANPAVTFSRMFTESFSGIGYTHFPLFLLAQIIGSVGAGFIFRSKSNIAPKHD